MQQRIGSLQCELERERIQRLEAETIATGLSMDLNQERVKLLALGKELAKVKGRLEEATVDHENLLAAVGQVCGDLGVVPVEEPSLLSTRVLQIMAWVHELERDALRARVNRSFTIARSHYAGSINLEAMSLGYPEIYEEDELEKFEEEVAPLSQALADRIESVVLPQRG